MGLVEKILERLDVAAEETAKLLELIAAGKTGYWKVRNQILRETKGPPQDLVLWYRERQRFYTMLSHLKRDGLIEGKKKKGLRQSLWRITKKGLARLTNIRKARQNPFSRRNITYTKTAEPAFVLVVFDIPERQKLKRAWLRDSLRHLDFTFLQRSVWLGKTKLPEAFLRDLRRHRLLPYVHILSVTKKGTVQEFA